MVVKFLEICRTRGVKYRKESSIYGVVRFEFRGEVLILAE